MKPLPLRTSLTIVYTGMLALLLTAVAVGYYAAFTAQMDVDESTSLEEKARGLHGYLQFKNGAPVLVFNQNDLEAVAFIDDATDYYQVYDARNGRLLTQSPGLESLGLHYTPEEVAEFRENPGPHDVRTDRGTLRLSSSVVSPASGEAYLVQVGELLTRRDRILAGFDRLLLMGVFAGLLCAAAAGRWLAGRALAPLSRLADAMRDVDITNLHARLSVRGADDELDQVAQAFNDALGRVEKSVGEMRQFSAALAHELRTPLAILRGEAELAMRQPVSVEERRRQIESQIDEFDRLTRLINQILTLARAEAGEIRMADQLVDLPALGASVAAQIEPVAAARGITLTCDAAGGVLVHGDGGWLERLLLILLDNAIKFTPDGGRVSISIARANGRAEVAVTDTGIGITPDAAGHLFERFYRGDNAHSTEPQGAGLGLALAKWIARRHDGTIAVKSQPGVGSTFTVILGVAQ